MEMEKRFSDSSAGVLEMLREFFNFDVSGAVAEPDPEVSGVWRVRGVRENGRRMVAIAYLAGYCDSWGEVRAMNDVEAWSEDSLFDPRAWD